MKGASSQRSNHRTDRCRRCGARLRVVNCVAIVNVQIVEPAVLPENNQHADAVLIVEVQDGELVEASYDSKTMEKRRESARHRFDRLSECLPAVQCKERARLLSTFTVILLIVVDIEFA